MTIHHRPATREDRAFITPMWSASYKKSHTAGIIQNEDWPRVAHEAIGKILDRPGMRGVVAAATNDPDFVYGFIVGDTEDILGPPVIAYVYVKEPYRRTGIARGLFSAFGVEPNSRFVMACKTGIVSKLSSKIPFARFDNNAVRYPKEDKRTP
jgi:GNAT superfamily N-acetyltransferase